MIFSYGAIEIKLRIEKQQLKYELNKLRIPVLSQVKGDDFPDQVREIFFKGAY